MKKSVGIQEFLPFNELEHVFKSDKIKIVNSKGIEYTPGLNNQMGAKLVVSKYTKLCDLERSIMDRSFCFSSPVEWLDPIEMPFFRPRIRVGCIDNIFFMLVVLPVTTLKMRKDNCSDRKDLCFNCSVW